MSSPQSLKYYSFKDINNFQDKIFTDDYCYDNFESWKIKANTTKGGKIEYKAKVKDHQSQLDDEFKIQFPYRQKWFWMGAKRKGDLKFHIDLGQHNFRGKEYNAFTNLKTNAKFDDFKFRLGYNYFGQKCESSNRIECEGQRCLFSSRTLVNKKPYFYGYFGTIALDNMFPMRYDCVLGYEKDDAYIYLQHFSQKNLKYQGFILGDVQLQAILKKCNDQQVGISAKRTPDGNLTVQGAIQKNINSDWWVKARVSSAMDLSLATKYKLNSLMTITASAKIGLKATNAQDCLPFGLNFELGV